MLSQPAVKAHRHFHPATQVPPYHQFFFFKDYLSKLIAWHAAIRITGLRSIRLERDHEARLGQVQHGAYPSLSFYLAVTFSLTKHEALLVDAGRPQGK